MGDGMSCGPNAGSPGERGSPPAITVRPRALGSTTPGMLSLPQHPRQRHYRAAEAGPEVRSLRLRAVHGRLRRVTVGELSRALPGFV